MHIGEPMVKTVAERLAQRGIVCQHIQQHIEALGAVARTALAQKSHNFFQREHENFAFERLGEGGVQGFGQGFSHKHFKE